MKYLLAVLMMAGLWLGAIVSAIVAGQDDMASLERQFRELPMEARRMTGPLFWLHGDESRQRLEMYVGKVAEGGNGCFTAESRPHVDWLGSGWFRDLAICLDAAKQHDLKMWIFDEQWWPSQGVGGKVPPRYAAKRLEAASTDLQGPWTWEAEGYAGERYVAALAGRLAVDGRIEGDSLVDLAPHVRDGRLSWQVPAGKWKVMKFTHVQAPALGQNGQLSVDGASKDCVDWFLQTVYQPHYDHFQADFGKNIPGFFYDEPETRGDWGTELSGVLAEWNVDWKKAYAAYKFELAGEEQIAARYQYLDAFAETWGRTMYGGMTHWCHAHGVKSIGHFMEHGGLYHNRDFCAGDMMRLQGYSDMGAIDAVGRQFAIGKREADNPPTWQTPKLASSISHVYGKPDDVAMVEIFGARGQDLAYSEMKWWIDHMQVSGVNFMIPHSFNPRAPYDTDCPPYFYNGGYEPRWPLYRVYADYTSRLSLMLSGGRHVCPVAILFDGNLGQVGKMIPPEAITTALQDAQLDCDWLPMDVFEREAAIKPRPVGKTGAGGAEIQLHGERYRVLVLPPVEVIRWATLTKIMEFFNNGGLVISHGYLPSKSATIGKTAKDVAAILREVWNKESGKYDVSVYQHEGFGFVEAEDMLRGGRWDIYSVLTDMNEAAIGRALEIRKGEDDPWLHVLHRQKADRDIFLVANQNHQGKARQYTFRVIARGEPECWDPMRNEITTPRYQRIDAGTAEVSLALEPLETVLLVFQPKRQPRPLRIDAGVKPIHEAILLTRDPNPAAAQLPPLDANRPKTVSPVAAADPFRGHFAMPADLDAAQCRICLEMDGLPDDSAAVSVNGVYVGGVIGRPPRLDITRCLKPGQNTVVIEPLAPKSARIVFYSRVMAAAASSATDRGPH